MITVETKKMPNGKWSCFSTFLGYDYAFVSESKESSQSQMRNKLKERHLEHKATFTEEKIYPAFKKTTPIAKWIPPFLDFNPIA